jgi:hypothetical protein
MRKGGGLGSYRTKRVALYAVAKLGYTLLLSAMRATENAAVSL